MGSSATLVLYALVLYGLAALLVLLFKRDMDRRGVGDPGRTLILVAVFVTMPIGPLLYLVASSLGFLDGAHDDIAEGDA